LAQKKNYIEHAQISNKGGGAQQTCCMMATTKVTTN